MPTSGVPQGSNLGPILFLLFINDVVASLQCEVLLFADDMKLYHEIKSYDDCLFLQQDLIRVNDWCRRNKFTLNISKCKSMTYTRKRLVHTFRYSLSDVMIDRCILTKDLGVAFDSQLTFVSHIGSVVAGAYRMYGFIYRSCRDFDSTECLSILFNAFIRSKLEYCSLVWCPIYTVHMLSVESVQRRFLKYLVYIVDGTYPVRGCRYDIMLDRFGFTSLYDRRFVTSIKFLYNLLNNKIDCAWLLDRVDFNIPRLSSRYQYPFYCPRRNTNVMIRSPIYMMCSNFNSISNAVDINFNTITDIINSIQSHH